MVQGLGFRKIGLRVKGKKVLGASRVESEVSARQGLGSVQLPSI